MCERRLESWNWVVHSTNIKHHHAHSLSLDDSLLYSQAQFVATWRLWRHTTCIGTIRQSVDIAERSASRFVCVLHFFVFLLFFVCESPSPWRQRKNKNKKKVWGPTRHACCNFKRSFLYFQDISLYEFVVTVKELFGIQTIPIFLFWSNDSSGHQLYCPCRHILRFFTHSIRDITST